jgi:hypothetical protein
MRLLRIGVLFLLASALFAQRGGMRGGSGGRVGGTGRSFVGRGISGGRLGGGFGFNRSAGFSRGIFRGPRYGFGFGFGSGFWGYGYPGFYDYGYGYSPYAYSPYGYSPCAYSNPYYEPPPPVAAAQDYGPPPAAVREYSAPPPPPAYRDPLYLIAFKDHKILAAVAYWVEGDTLYYVTREHEQKQVSLDEIDRPFSEQLNRDRRVDFRLPR